MGNKKAFLVSQGLICVSKYQSLLSFWFILVGFQKSGQEKA